MSQLLFYNNANSTLAGAITNTATSLTVQAGGGALWSPGPSAGQFFVATLVDAATGLLREIIWVTNVTGDTMTIVRAQEGTTALNWSAGDIVASLVTAGMLEDLLQASQAQTQSPNYAVDTGAANAYVAAFVPAITANVAGMPLRVKIANSNTGASTFNNGAGAQPVKRRDGSALIGGELQAGDIAEFKWDGTNHRIWGVAPATAAAVTAGTDTQSAITPAQLAAAVAAVGIPRSYIAGITAAFNSTTVLGTSSGQCTDSTNTVSIVIGAFTKSTAGLWTAGSGNNGMGNGLTIANATWYHVFAIVVAGVSDIYFDTSVTAANKPAGVTAFRRVGSFLTDGSAHIIQFFIIDDATFWTNGVEDVAVTNLGTSAVLYALSVPPGIRVRPISRFLEQATANAIIVSGPDETDVAPNTSTGVGPLYDIWYQGGGTSDFAPPYFLYTNTSQQIRARANGSPTTFSVFTRGYIDTRGRLG